MAELRVRTIDESELDTVLAHDIEFEGTIEFSEPLLVKGHTSGEIRTKSDLFIADSARIDADIRAARVSVKGTVHGDIEAEERIELFSGAEIVGNIRSPDLIIQSGSRFTGHCSTSDSPDASPERERESTVPTTEESSGTDPIRGNGADRSKSGEDQR